MSRHMLSAKDFVSRTAVCSICGPVRLRKFGPNWRCAEATRIQRQRDKIKARYGLTWAEWSVLLVAQSGRCAICSTPLTDPYVDHCHTTGRVRGMLCRPCNMGLGFFLNDPSLLRAAASYL